MRITKNVVRVIALGIIFISFGFKSAVAQSPSYTKKELQNLYTKYLTEEGYMPKVDEDGDVVFKRESRVYFIKVSENDPQFFTIILPNFYPIKNGVERLRVYAAADFSNGMTKVCKINTVKDDVWAAIEMFVASPADFKNVFQRSMSALDSGVTNFALGMIRNIGQPLSVPPTQRH